MLISISFWAVTASQNWKMVTVRCGLPVTALVNQFYGDVQAAGGSRLDTSSLIRRLRSADRNMPVLILTARGNWQDKVEGLESGADDYVIKPFSMKELLARVGAVLRRSCNRPTDVSTIKFANGSVDMERREVVRDDGQRSELSERECLLLAYLARNSERAIDRRELLENVWGLNPRGITTRTIDMHIARLREKLGDDASKPLVLLTVRGKGYMMARSPA